MNPPTVTITLRPSQAVAAGVAVLLIGMAVRGALMHPSTASRHQAPALATTDAPVPAGPTQTMAGMPVGFAHRTDGAVAAAIAYVCDGQRLLDTPPADLPAAVRAITAADSAEAQLADIQARLSALEASLKGGNGPVVFHQAAIAARLDSYSVTQARVALWNVGVLSRAGVAPPQAAWDISSVELVWESGDWKLRAETTSPGPAPLSNDAVPPATSADLGSTLAGFQDLDGVTR
jgi:hypothetical protein